jgi:uncharacterized delta-60 repeat protein
VKRLSISFAAVAALIVVGLAVAAPGDLDTSFNGSGSATTSIGAGVDEAFALARQANGSLVVAGATSNPPNSSVVYTDFALARFTAAGALDPSFGVAGKVTTKFGPNNDAANALVVQPNGRLVAAGSSVNASLDNDFALARYKPNGSLDPAFGTGGKVTTPVGPSDDLAHALVLQPNGRLVAAGESWVSGHPRFALVRYKPNGSLDPTFGIGGKVKTAIGSGARAEALVLQPDGKLVAAGFTDGAGKSDFTLVRYKPNGALDPTFGSGGKVKTSFGPGDDLALALVRQPDGKLVAAGLAYPGAASSATRFALVRYKVNGALDPTFGSGGRVETSVGPVGDVAYGLAIRQGKLVAAGYSQNGQKINFALVRYRRTEASTRASAAAARSASRSARCTTRRTR